MKTPSDGLANPDKLGPAKKQNGIVQAIVETPKGSRNKFAFDPEQKIFALSRILPAGMVFPLDFGFLPGTKAPDGDPLDVLLIMDEPAYPGIAVRARLIGILEGEQIEEDGTKLRNDRLLAVAEATQIYAGITGLEEVPKVLLLQLEEFFVNYHRLQGRQYRPLGWKGSEVAIQSIEKQER
jgi:inorganic pyrophosphatase